MMDLREGLGRIGGDLTASTVEQADTDLALGRRAARRRRIRQAVGGSLATAVAAVAALSLSVNGDSPDAVVAGPPAASASASSLRLASYGGRQPEYYTVDWVPQGWFVQHSDRGGLIIAPDAARQAGPDVNPSGDPLYDPRDVSGKISVTLSDQDWKRLPPGIKLQKIGDYQGMVIKEGAGYRSGVVLLLPGRGSIEVSFAEDIGLSDQQMLQIAAGVHVSPKAKPAAG